MIEIFTGEAAQALADLLSDESRIQGTADGIAQPSDHEQLAELISNCAGRKEPMTISAGLTGITGGGVPQGGVAINLNKMDRILGLRRKGDAWFVRCQPGVVLAKLNESLHYKEFEDSDEWDENECATLREFQQAPPQIFPCDPTETSACIGGMAACNASGARSFHYGAMRFHVEGIRAVLADGSSFSLKRGQSLTGEGRSFNLCLDNGEVLQGRLPAYRMPEVKNAAGYYAADNMDLMDVFIGSEGTLCVFSELELRLTAAPEQILGIICFFPSEEVSLQFMHSLRDNLTPDAILKPLALEFFDHRALALLRSEEGERDNLGIPDLQQRFHTAIYAEFGGSNSELDDILIALTEVTEKFGVDEDATWAAIEPHEHDRLRDFRHLVPETVNRRIGEYQRNCPGITKLGTDMAVPPQHLDEMMELYRSTLDSAGLDYVIFGHIGQNHLHVNILPRDEGEYEAGKEIYKSFARQAVDFGGTISAEHGVGKLKTFLLPFLYGDDGIEEMRATRNIFDPEGLLNQGTLFEPK